MYKNKILPSIHIIITCIMLIIIAILLLGNNPEKLTVECVPTETEAIAICEVICNKAYPDLNLEQYELDCIDNGENWIVFYYKEGQSGGLPEVHIRKDTAEVTLISLAA